MKRLLLTITLFVTLVYSTVWYHLIYEGGIAINPMTAWRSSDVDGDAGYNLAQLDSFAASIGPYKFRVMATFAVRVIRAATGLPGELAFVIFNALCLIVTGTGFTYYLMRWHKFTYPIALLGGVLTVTTVSLQSMLLLPMPEPATYVAALVLFWALQDGRPLVFVAGSIFAVLTKEVFVVAAIVYLYMCWYRARSSVHVSAPGFRRKTDGSELRV